MMQFTPQQASGGPKYSHKTKIGNWLEDLELEEMKVKDYMEKKQAEKLSISKTEQKLQKSLAGVPWSYSPDGLLHFGSKIMLHNKKTNGFLALDIGSRLPSIEESYTVTASSKPLGPVARSVFVVVKADDKDKFKDDVVHYGQKIRLQTNAHVFPKPLYLKSSPVSPSAHSPVSRHQECCVLAKATYDTVWCVQHISPNERFLAKGEPVPVNQPIIIEHCGTSNYLAADVFEFKTDFGIEYEVSVHSYSTLNKSQQLQMEKTGKLTRDLPTKFQVDQNVWAFVASEDPSTDYKVVEVGKTTYEDLLRMIRQKLLERGAYGIRGLGRIFRAMDENGNHKLDPDDFRWGLYNYGISISKEEAALLVEVCDRDKDGNVDFTEFLRFLRPSLSEARQRMVQLAYQKLDKTGDGKVTIEDIAAAYDASKHPDVKTGKATPEDVFREFMKQWDTQVKDGIVTLDEFMEYYKDVSAMIDKDEYFEEMMKNAWKL